VTNDAEHDYSHRTLFEKLGVEANMHVALIGEHDEAFRAELGSRMANGPAETLRTKYDMIFLRVNSKADLASIPEAAQHLRPDGALWVIHPKGQGADPTDAEVRTAGIAAGLVDNKISAYGDTHTATRYVIPRDRRPTA
jgi:hypothetical protein